MKKSLLFIFWACLAQWLHGQNSLVPVKHFDRYNGLPAKRLYVMCRDNDGFMWLGAENGVFRFDGRTFYQYTTREGLCDNEILSIYADSKSRVWCSGYNGKISVIENGVVNTALPFVKEWNSKGMVRDFMEDSLGNIFVVCEHSQALKITPDGQVLDLGLDSTKIWPRRIFMHRGQIFVNDLGRLFRYDGVGKFTNVTPKPDIRRYTVVSEDYDAVWALDKKGICENVYTGQTINMEAYIGGYIFHICQVNERYVLISLHGIRPFLYDLEKNIHRDIELPEGASVPEMLLDPQNNLWMITPLHGLFAVKLGQEETRILPLPGFSEHIVNACEFRGELIAVTSNCILVVADKRRHTIKRLPFQESKISLMVDRIWFEEVKDSLYISSFAGVFSYRDGKIHEQGYGRNGLKDFQVYRDTLLIGRGYRAMFGGNHGIQKVIFTGRTYSMCLQGDRLWFTTLDGLQHYDIPTDSIHGVTYQVPGNGRIEYLLDAGHNLLIAATGNNGVLLLKDGEMMLRQLTVDDGLQDDDCKELDVFPGGMVVRHPLGLSLIEREGLRIHTVSEWKGLPMGTVNNLRIYGDSVLLSSTRGLFRVGLSDLFGQLPERRKVKFLQVASGGELLLPDDIELPHSANRLRVDFAIPEYDQPGLIQYHWRINDGEWNKTSTTTLELADLKPGDYVLQVKAKAPGFGWSEVSQLSFYIRSPFWQTPWFMAAAVAAVVIFFLVFQQRWYAKKLATEREKASIRHQLMSYEQKALNAMMNPHFVFNAMGSIQYLLNKGHIEQANDYLVKFSRLIRMSLETSQMEFCLLDDEIERLTLYLQLEKMRLNGRMTFGIEVDDNVDAENLQIPTMILQTYVENAIIHGASAVSRDTRVVLRFALRADMLSIVIEDDGPGFDPTDNSKRSKRFGSAATEKRLQLLTQITGRPYRVHIISPLGPAGGTRVELDFSAPK